MKGRIVSTVALIALLAGVLYIAGAQGGIWLLALMAALAQRELYTLLERSGSHPMQRAGTIAGVLLVLGAFYLPGEDPAGLVLALAILGLSIAILFDERMRDPMRALAPTIFGVAYIPFLLSFYALTTRVFAEDGNHLPGLLAAVWIIASAKASDIGALLTGRCCGRTKLAPNLSPAKTWEGALGGIAFACAIGGLYAWALADKLPDGLTPLLGALLAAPVALVSIFSDLVESLLKRKARIKDSGSILPGIGGALDLMDSLVLTAPAGYFLLRLTLG